MGLNLFFRFPRGTAGYGTVINPDIEVRLKAAYHDGLIALHRGDDTFEVLWITMQLWQQQSRLIRKHFPEATLLQYIG